MSPRILNKSRHIFYLVTGLIGTGLFIWSLPVYHLTFIAPRFLFMIIAAIAAIASLLSFYQFRSAYRFNIYLTVLLNFGWSILSWGLLGTCVFLFSNYYLSSGIRLRKEFNIEERADKPGIKGERENLRPAFTIVYQGLEKQLVFGNRFYKWKDDYKTVILTLQEGKWGFEVIKGKAVTK